MCPHKAQLKGVQWEVIKLHELPHRSMVEEDSQLTDHSCFSPMRPGLQQTLSHIDHSAIAPSVTDIWHSSLPFKLSRAAAIVSQWPCDEIHQSIHHCHLCLLWSILECHKLLLDVLFFLKGSCCGSWREHLCWWISLSLLLASLLIWV